MAQALIACAECLAAPRDVTPDLVEIWTQVLAAAGIAPGEVEPITARLIAAQRFFPSPAEFLAVARPPDDHEGAAELAWQPVLSAVRRVGGYGSLTAADLGGDAALLWVVGRLGWVRLCDELCEDNRGLWRAEFVRLFRLAQSERAGGGGISWAARAAQRRDGGRADRGGAAGLESDCGRAGGATAGSEQRLMREERRPERAARDAEQWRQDVLRSLLGESVTCATGIPSFAPPS